MEIGEILCRVLATFIVLAAISGLIQGVILYPISLDKAQIECESKGFDTFIDYILVVYSSKPIGLYCGTYEQRMIREGKITAYSTDRNNSIIISDLGSGGE